MPIRASVRLRWAPLRGVARRTEGLRRRRGVSWRWRHLYEGATRTQAAAIGGVTLADRGGTRVVKFNAHGPDGRRRPQGARAALSGSTTRTGRRSRR